MFNCVGCKMLQYFYPLGLTLPVSKAGAEHYLDTRVRVARGTQAPLWWGQCFQSPCPSGHPVPRTLTVRRSLALAALTDPQDTVVPAVRADLFPRR